mgnify:CR=1 FL=1
MVSGFVTSPWDQLLICSGDASPIFMDSTFQRVDDIRKLNILDILPEFGSQVIVLAYDGEIGEKHIVRERLGTHLLKEYDLHHTTSSKTSIDSKFD